MNDWRLRKGVALIEVHGVFLLAADRDARRNCCFVCEINSIGALIWNLLSEGKTREEILTAIKQEYQIPEGHDPEKDLDEFIRALRENNYIICEAQEE